MKTALTIAMTLTLGCLACAGGNNVENPVTTTDGAPALDLYLGLEPPSSVAVVFAPGVVCKNGRYEYAMSIHPAGDHVLFTVEDPKTGAAVLERRFDGDRWTSPEKVNLSEGAKKMEMEAFFSPDGERVFFAPFGKGMDVRIWTALVTPLGFSDPHPLGDPVAEDPSFYPVQATDGTLYYTNLAARAVWRATLDDDVVIHAEPTGLDRGGHAFPSPDGTYMLLDSAALGSEEQRDIYVSFRNDDGTWGPSKPLGPAVNTEHSETCPSLSPDGEYLFFSRYDEPGGISDIYWISTEVIDLVAPV